MSKTWYYTYMLQCRDNKYYVGVTNNVEERLQQHNRGDDPGAFTYSRRPVKLVYYSPFTNPYDAIAWEKRLKGWSRAKKEAWVAQNWDRIQELAVCQNDSHYKNYAAPFDYAQGDKGQEREAQGDEGKEKMQGGDADPRTK